MTRAPRGGAGDRGRAPLTVWSAAVAVYVLAVFHRSSLGVAGLAAEQRFDLQPSQLSSFTVLQLGVYAGLQIPVGMLIDRYGARRLLLCGATVMTGSQLAFALVDGYGAALLARVLLGAGDAMVFVSVLRLVAAWFPPRRTALMTVLTGSVGQIGALVATVPLVAALDAYGWTATFAVSASAGVLAGLLVYVIVADEPPGRVRPPVVGVRLVALREAWRNPGIRLGYWTHSATQLSTNTFLLLWGYPFLVESEDVGPHTAGSLLTIAGLVFVVGGPLVSWFIVRHPWHRSTLVLTVIALTVGAWSVVLAWPGAAPLPVLVVLAVVVGMGSPTSTVGFDYARSFAPTAQLGVSMAIVNVGGFLSALLTVLAVGALLDQLGHGPGSMPAGAAYPVALSVQYVGWGLGTWQVLRLRRRLRRAGQEDGRTAPADGRVALRRR